MAAGSRTVRIPRVCQRPVVKVYSTRGDLAQSAIRERGGDFNLQG